MSNRKCPDVKDMTRWIRRLGVELRATRPEVPKEEYLLVFHERFGNVLTPEQVQYALGEYVWPIAKRAMKDLEAADEGIVEDRQMVLPGSLRHLKVPKAMPIEVNGKQRTVTSVYAGIPEGDAFTETLQRNANACVVGLTEWLEVWVPARAVMVEHKGWDFGMALEYLARKEEEEER